MDQNGCILIYFKRNPYGKIFAYTILYKIDIIYNVATPRQAQKGGLTLQDLFIVNAFQLLLKGGQWASQLGDKIPQPVVATIVHYLLLIVFVGGIAIGVGFLIFLGASKVFEFYTEDYADTMSLAVFLISLAVSVYFAEFIRAVIPINLLLLLILVHIVYVLIRWYVKGCMRSRGYY